MKRKEVKGQEKRKGKKKEKESEKRGRKKKTDKEKKNIISLPFQCLCNDAQYKSFLYVL